MLCARKDEKIIAIAAASKVSGNIMEVGIDVNKEWRGYGLRLPLVVGICCCGRILLVFGSIGCNDTKSRFTKLEFLERKDKEKWIKKQKWF